VHVFISYDANHSSYHVVRIIPRVKCTCMMVGGVRERNTFETAMT